MEISVERLSENAVDCGYNLHKNLGPGLLETAYEKILASLLAQRGLKVDRQMPIKIIYENTEIDKGFGADLLVENKLLIELKSTEHHHPVHTKQVLTYLRLMELPLGLLMNFGAPTFKRGCKWIVNNHTDFASSRLRVNQTEESASE